MKSRIGGFEILPDIMQVKIFMVLFKKIFTEN